MPSLMRGLGSGKSNSRTRVVARAHWVAFGAMVVLAFLAVVLNYAMLTVMSGGRAYVHGEARWSKGQQEAVFRLDRYAETGERRHLDQAYAALDIPLGDRQARLALTGPAYDYEAAREGLLQGQNHPRDVPTMIWLFEHFEHAPYLNDAIDIWARADRYILELAALAERLEREWNAPSLDRNEIERLRERLTELDQILRSHETRFSDTLAEGLHWLRIALTTGSTAALALLTGGVAWIFRWSTRRIAASEGKFWSTFEHAPVGVALVAEDGRYREVNDAFCRILGYERDELLGAPLEMAVYPDDCEPTGRLLEWARGAGEEGVTLERRYINANGYVLWGKLTLTAYPHDMSGEEPGMIAVLEDISEARELSDRLSYQASHDPLTGQLNRRRFEIELNNVLEAAHARHAHHVLAFLDLDQFKLINDTCGHYAGDAMLRQAAHVMEQALRKSDVLARLGGDEFGVILRDCNLETGRRIAEKLRTDLAAFLFTWEGRSFASSCSIGLVVVDETVSDANAALQMADTACYVAKEAGRDRIQVHSDDTTTTRARGEMEWVGRLREAITEDRLELWAQRIVPASGSTRLRYEVLVRLRDADGELHMPGAFLPAAERYDMGIALDRWVVNCLLQQLHNHPEHVEALERCHINLSGQSLGDPGFMEELRHVIGEAAFGCDRLCFEVTESTAIANLSNARTHLDAMREQGCLIALDDFGRGLSSLEYLKWLPVDILKIDGTFVRDVVEDRVDREMVRTIAQIGQIMELTTIAEFVESEAVLEVIRALGVDYVQGYGIEKPRPLAEFLAEPATRTATDI